MENGVHRLAPSPASPRAWARDALGAVGLVEGAIADEIFVATAEAFALPTENLFGKPITVERLDAGDGAGERSLDALASRAEARAAEGARITIVANAAMLGTARRQLASMATRRLSVVVHAITEGHADAIALADLGWGVLFAAGAEESFDMSLLARRAAEDSGTPFIVVHEHSAVRQREPVLPLDRELCEVFVGPASTRLRKVSDPAHPVHANVTERVFAERVQFALGSAMRELESLTGRRHDVLDRRPAGDAQVFLVGLGAVGEALLAAVERLRASGHDVGAIKINALRPFPGPRLVKALSRALAVSVLESLDEPLAQSNPLTRELKAAFADALTWAPEYPGIGRIPRILSGVAHASRLAPADLDAVVHNMLADERGKRSFVVGADVLVTGDPLVVPADHDDGSFTLRGRTNDDVTAEAGAELCASVILSVLGLRTRAAVRELTASEGGGFAFDLVASRERPCAAPTLTSLKLIVIDDPRALILGNPLARLARGGVLAVPTETSTPDALWGEVPPYVKAIVFDRGARVVGFPVVAPAGADGNAGDGKADVGPGRFVAAAAFAGIALAFASSAGRRAIDPSLVAREVSEAVLFACGAGCEATAKQAGELARRTFEAHVEVPRTTVEKDSDAIRLGRQDARSIAVR
ncbi:MAG: Pyruvate flavodoxin/ferredoxin oxidoreductase domain protein [Myxococcaceae bacterium]|nr:Pyruvate flavodoxin/ferredoxin oxidoreductase domain protein [Myxococcaceae bacterium]